MLKDTLTTRFEQLKAARPDLARRVDKAADLLARHLNNRAAGLIRARLTADGTLVYIVKGSRGVEYQTTYKTCTCPDAQDARRSGVCYHQLAIRALEALVEHRHGEPIPVAVLSLAPVAPPAPAAPVAPRRPRLPYREELDR